LRFCFGALSVRGAAARIRVAFLLLRFTLVCIFDVLIGFKGVRTYSFAI